MGIAVNIHSIVIPLEQGLRHTSTIPTVKNRNSIVIPLEQGLRPLIEYSHTSKSDSIVIPLEQGLRLFPPPEFLQSGILLSFH